MKRYLFFFTLLLYLHPLRAQETLAFADFSGGSIEPLKLSSDEGLTPNVEVVTTSAAPGGVGTAAVRLDDSEAEKQGRYGLTLYFPPQQEGVLVAKAVVRVPEGALQGSNTAIDIRMSVGGDAYAVTYLRLRKNGDQFLWSVYDPRESKHRTIEMPVSPGDWYAVEQRIDLQNKTYDWSIQNLSDISGAGKAEGKNEVFYQAFDKLSFLTFASVERGGVIEIANVSVEQK